MRKISEDLYFGNIAPYEKRTTASLELRRLANRANDCEIQLAERLNEEERQLLNVLTNAQQKIDSLDPYDDAVLRIFSSVLNAN